jgi:hypothetical protein
MAVLATTGSLAAHGATIWEESVDGDFSGNGLEPTAVFASAGSNVVVGSTGNSGQGIDRDYFTFLVPDGSVLSSILLIEDETNVSGGASFIGIQPGPQLTVSTSGAGAELLVALGHYDNSQRGSDLLPAIQVGPLGPLPSGHYAIWVQETGGPATYGFDFVITQVPEPAHWGLMLVGLPLVLMIRRRARR